MNKVINDSLVEEYSYGLTRRSATIISTLLTLFGALVAHNLFSYRHWLAGVIFLVLLVFILCLMFYLVKVVKK